MVFTWNNSTNLTKLSDVLNESNLNMTRIFIEPWILFLGGWFFAAVIGVLAGALYIKQHNIVPPLVLFIVMTLLFSGVLMTDPAGDLTSAETFVYIIGIMGAFAIGFVFYQLFVSKRE